MFHSFTREYMMLHKQIHPHQSVVGCCFGHWRMWCYNPRRAIMTCTHNRKRRAVRENGLGLNMLSGESFLIIFSCCERNLFCVSNESAYLTHWSRGWSQDPTFGVSGSFISFEDHHDFMQAKFSMVNDEECGNCVSKIFPWLNNICLKHPQNFI